MELLEKYKEFQLPDSVISIDSNHGPIVVTTRIWAIDPFVVLATQGIDPAEWIATHGIAEDIASAQSAKLSEEELAELLGRYVAETAE